MYFLYTFARSFRDLCGQFYSSAHHVVANFWEKGGIFLVNHLHTGVYHGRGVYIRLQLMVENRKNLSMQNGIALGPRNRLIIF